LTSQSRKIGIMRELKFNKMWGARNAYFLPRVMIGPYDQLLVGYARSKGSILVTNNRHEFDRVPHLRMEDRTVSAPLWTVF
ncbi:hypothetical protein NMC30_22795, partial [Agrobacterium tumefaciens]|nr:hypothetical protein [Agrobacterium tumefaciens]